MGGTNAPVIPNQYIPPPDTSTPDMGGGGVPQGPAPVAPQVTPTAAATVLSGDPGAMMNHAAAVHHGRLASALNAVGTLLGGDTTYHITTNADGSVDATPTPSTPGEKWGRIAKAALTGAAKGFEVGQGPGGAQRAAAAGIETGMAMPQAQQDQTMAQAQKMNDQNQQKLMFNANLAYLNTRNLEASWALGNNKQLATEHDEDRDVQFNALQKQLHMIDIGPAPDVEKAAIIYNSNQQVQQALVGKGGQLIVHHPASGPPHAYIIPEDKLNQFIPTEQTAYTYGVDPETGNVTKTGKPIAANSETGLNAALRTATENAGLLNAVKIGSTVKLQNAQAAKARSEANKPETPVGTWQKMFQGNTPVLWNDRTNQVINANADLVSSATREKQDAAIEKQVKPIRDALSYADNYLALTKHTGPGDEALQEKFFNLARPDSGFRMTTPVITQLNNSRSMIEAIRQKGQHLADGTWFTQEQRQQIADTMKLLADSSVSDPSTLRSAPTSTAGGGTAGMPEQLFPARPGGKIPTTYNGKPGVIDANGLFTPDDGSAPVQVPGRGPAAPATGGAATGGGFNWNALPKVQP